MHSLVLPDGRRLCWREQGQGMPLVMLHGWAMASAVFAPALEALSGEFRVLAPDLRGHGASDPGRGYSFADFAEDLSYWLDALGLQRPHLLGWSMGGQIALELCRSRPARIDRLLLVSSTPRFAAADGWPHGLPPGQVRNMSRTLSRDHRAALERFYQRLFVGETAAAEGAAQLFRQVDQNSGLPAAATALAALETLANTDQRSLLGDIFRPTLITHGEEDVIVPVTAGAFLAEAIAGARLLRLPGLSHAPFLSSPREVFQLWREFLQ
ncbi:MAG: alpha/beta fold hydrolase [Desulfuromonadaceae bacterium]